MSAPAAWAKARSDVHDTKPAEIGFDLLVAPGTAGPAPPPSGPSFCEFSTSPAPVFFLLPGGPGFLLGLHASLLSFPRAAPSQSASSSEPLRPN